MTLETLALQGHPEVHGSMASLILDRIKEVRSNLIKECFCDFQHLDHRMESVTNVHGIEFINDSRSTNINSTWFTLESMSKPIIWIAGGKDCGIDYTPLKPLLRNKVRSIIFLGMDSTNFILSMSDIDIPIMDATTMEEAVEMAYSVGKMGEIILLSPGCPSFDLFKNYEERGDAFRKAVKHL
ncbi:MAG: cyanophycin synthetase [Bacteroidales bacterium]|jgi:UDP-N-acetylmuramoylalanine--D-glutamate ligase